MGSYVPTTALVATQRTRQQAARDRAEAKAYEQSRVGNLPTLLRSTFTGDAIREVWAVGSRTTGTHTLCDCPADDCCWHRAACRLASSEALPCHNPTGFRMRPKWAVVRDPQPDLPAPLAFDGRNAVRPITAAELSGRVA